MASSRSSRSIACLQPAAPSLRAFESSAPFAGKASLQVLHGPVQLRPGHFAAQQRLQFRVDFLLVGQDLRDGRRVFFLQPVDQVEPVLHLLEPLRVRLDPVGIVAQRQGRILKLDEDIVQRLQVRRKRGVDPARSRQSDETTRRRPPSSAASLP